MSADAPTAPTEPAIVVDESSAGNWNDIDLAIEQMPTEVTPAPVAPAVTPVAATPPAPAEPVPAEPDILPRVRTGHLSKLNQQVVTILGRNPDMLPEEAVIKAKEALGIVDAPPAEPQEPDTDPLETMNDRLAAVQAELDQIAASGGTGDLYSPEVDRLNRERAELLTDIRIEQRDREAAAARDAQQHASAFDTQRNEAADRALTEFPIFGDETAPVSQALMREINQMLAVEQAVRNGDESPLDDPNIRLRFAEFQHPDYPVLVAQRLARQHGIQPVSGVPAGAAPQSQPSGNPTPAQVQQQATSPQMAPISGSQGVARVEVAPASDQDQLQTRLAEVKEGDWSALDAALDGDSPGGYSPGIRIL